MDKTNFRDPSQPTTKRAKIIKRYGNRKLYDTEQSSYVVLSDIAKMIRNQENIQVIDNETNHDITLSTLIQIIFGAEKKTSAPAPVDILKSIIREGDGSFSSFLAKIGLFNLKEKSQKKPMGRNASLKAFSTNRHGVAKHEEVKSIGAKVANLIKNMEKDSDGKSSSSIPQLPGNGLNN